MSAGRWLLSGGLAYAVSVPHRDLLDSAQHKLRLARYHGEALLDILAQHPHDGEDEPLRVPLEAQLEGMAYTGTAAAEKTIRALGPDRGDDDHMSIEHRIRAAKAGPSAGERLLASDFETWWMGRQRGTRVAQTARDLRNDAAHDVYEKAPDTIQWRVRIRNSQPVSLDDFARGYQAELDELAQLVERALELPVAAGPGH